MKMTKQKVKSKEEIELLGKKIVNQIEKGKNPEITFPLRNLSNIIYDKKTGTLKLGDKKGTRNFFNVAHAKKFLQTVEVASIIKKELLDSGKHEHLRGVFYISKRTIPGTNVNLVDEQVESLAPDEPLLVRINKTMKFMTGEEILNYVKVNGRKIYDDGKKERYTNIGLKVCSFDSDYKIKELPATLFIKHPSNKIVKIRTSSGKTVKVTLSHSLFTSKYGLPISKEVKDLKIGDWIAVPRKIEIDIFNEDIDVVQNLIDNCPTEILSLITLKGDKSTLNEILKNVDKNKLRQFIKSNYTSNFSAVLGNWKRSAIPLTLVKDLSLNLSAYYGRLKISCKGAKHSYNCKLSKNTDLGLIIGFLLSEGAHTLSERKGERSLSISNKNSEYLQDFNDSFIRNFGDRPAGEIALNTDGVYRLNIGYDLLSYIFEYALEYKVCRAWDKILPPFLFDANEDVISSFLRWFRFGDGSVYSSNTHKLIRLHTTSPNLVNGLLFLLLRLGIRAKVYERDPITKNSHKSFEIRIGNREDVEKLAQITQDFKGLNISKRVNFSSDRIPDVGILVKNNASKLILNEEAYKKFNWYGWDKQETICRTTLQNSATLLSQFGEIDEIVKIVSDYDIAWDKVVNIEDAGVAPYTIDISVPNTQNFIGGNGLLLLHNSDKAIEDLEVITGLSREQMHVSANKMGSMVGNVTLEDSGDTIDCSKLGRGGYSIPSITDELSFIKVSAKYILYMEKAAIFERLNEDKFWQKNNCILVTSQGQTTRGIRRLLQRLSDEENLPIYVLTDFDCWGFYIYSVIKYGSIALAHASERLTIPGVKFLGITADDVVKYDLKKHLIKLNEQDITRMKQVSEYEWFKDNKDWQRQLKMMKDFGAKAEIQALATKGISFISEVYLPTKIKNKEFID